MYHVIIFICGVVTIFKLQIFAEFSVRVPQANKKFSTSNLGRYFPKIRMVCLLDLHRLQLKASSADISSLSKIWQDFAGTYKNNQNELEKLKNIIRKEIFCIFSRKKNF